MQNDFTKRYFLPLLLLLLLGMGVVWLLSKAEGGGQCSDISLIHWGQRQLHLKDSLATAADSLKAQRSRAWEQRKAMWDAQKAERKAKWDAPVELNTASVDELTRLTDVGQRRARAIVEYRERLGGFVSIEQLREISSIPTSLAQELIGELGNKILLKTMEIRKISINFATQNALEAHPYISANMAHRIAQGIKMKGVIVNYQQLTKRDILTPQEARQLAPYIEYDTVAYPKTSTEN